tara:strand:- start:203 stop:1426 length:1224 start_codon:yes stop_codon:yes gene_type:complete
MVSYKYVVLSMFLGTIFSVPGHAQSIKDIVNQSREIMNNPGQIIGDEKITNTHRASEIQQNLLDEIQDGTTQQMTRGTEMLKGTQFDPGDVEKLAKNQEPTYDKHGFRYEIFASRSLQPQGLKQVFSLAARHHSSVVVFQGIRKGQKIGEGVRELHELIRDIKPVPNAVIDPKRFRDYGIENVPAVIAYDRNNKEVARVSGTANPDYLVNEIRRDNTGDLGIVGTVYDITEPNLIDVMRKKVLEVDWQEKTKGAHQRYLNNLQFVNLPVAKETRTFRVKPINRLTRDLKVPNSDMVYPAGLQFNPLEYHSFRTFIIVFDATDPEQLHLAGRLADEQSELRPVSLITTKIKREEGFKWLGEIENQIGFPIFILKKDFARTLNVKSVPSTIEADAENLVITTFGPEDWE